jgi:hypothetical protein
MRLQDAKPIRRISLRPTLRINGRSALRINGRSAPRINGRSAWNSSESCRPPGSNHSSPQPWRRDRYSCEPEWLRHRHRIPGCVIFGKVAACFVRRERLYARMGAGCEYVYRHRSPFIKNERRDCVVVDWRGDDRHLRHRSPFPDARSTSAPALRQHNDNVAGRSTGQQAGNARKRCA